MGAGRELPPGLVGRMLKSFQKLSVYPQRYLPKTPITNRFQQHSLCSGYKSWIQVEEAALGR